jgi:hypothetical protein
VQSPEPVGSVHVERLQLHIIQYSYILLCLLHTEVRCFEGKANRCESPQRRVKRLSLHETALAALSVAEAGGTKRALAPCRQTSSSYIQKTNKTRGPFSRE